MRVQRVTVGVLVVIPWVLTLLYLSYTLNPTTVWIGKTFEDGFWVITPERQMLNKAMTTAFIFVCIGFAYAAGASDSGVVSFKGTRKGAILSTALWVVLMISVTAVN